MMAGRTFTNRGLLWFIPLLCYLIQIADLGYDIGLTSLLELKSSIHLLVIKPWTLLSYALVHTSWLHLLINTILLSLLISTRKLSDGEGVVLFFFGVLLGGITFVLLSPTETSILRGASSGIVFLTPIVLFRLMSQLGRMIPVLILIITIDLVTSDWTLYVTPIIHLVGYLSGSLYLLLFDKDVVYIQPSHKEQKTIRYQQVIHKAHSSGYSSLSSEEKQVLS